MRINGVTQATYGYDAIGNIQNTRTTNQLWYAGPGYAHPHAPWLEVQSGNTYIPFAYDANGNTTSYAWYSYAYDAENRRTGNASGVTYHYAGDGSLVKRTTSTGKTLYVGGIFEKNVNNSGTVLKVFNYYTLGGRRVAMRQFNFGATPGTLYFLLADHLGSTTNVLTSAGASQSSLRYWPYGETRSSSGISPTDKQFTGQQNELNIFDPAGSYFYHARFYSPVLGRFLSADPIIAESGNPQSWNGYSYGGNNPIRYSDPTGRRRLDEIDADQEQYQIEQYLRAIARQQERDLYRQQMEILAQSAALNLVGQCLAGQCSATTPVEAAGAGLPVTSSGIAHAIFGAIGIFCPCGDLWDAELSYLEGDEVGAGLATLGLLPAGGDAAKYLFKYGDEGAEISAGMWRALHLLPHAPPPGTTLDALGAASIAANKSLFAPGTSIPDLLTTASRYPAYQQTNGNFNRIVVAEGIIGYDVNSREYTEVYTVITDANNNLVTAHPGIPGPGRW